MALPTLPASARRILDLLRSDRAAARAALAELPLEAQVELVCTTPVERRGEVLDLVAAPEEIVPRLPEAELCFTVKAIGLADAAWLLEHATSEQLVACVDLDAWRSELPDRAALDHWLEAFAEAGDETLARAARSLDPELWVLELRHRIGVALRPSRDDPDWQVPPASHSLDGQFYFWPLQAGDDLEPVVRLLEALFQQDYWLYFRLLQGALWEGEHESQLWAERWREGRLQDLGFPPRDEALPIYAWLAPAERDLVPADARALDVDAWRLPVWQPSLPVAADARELLFRAAGELDAAERDAFFYAFLALANRVAVADGMPLGAAESTPAALERAAAIASAGLERLAGANGLRAVEVLRRTPLPHLFRVGANLLGERPPAPSGSSEAPAPEPEPPDGAA